MRRRKKKGTRFSGVFIVGMAFLGFIVVGLTVSMTLRACSRTRAIPLEQPQYADAAPVTVPDELENQYREVPPYEMADSIISFCMPAPLIGVSEQILYKTAYVVSYNKDTKIPNWVAWHLTADHTDGPYGRLNNFYEDDAVDSPKATVYDYRGSGWSRGHMCPAGDNKWDENAMYESFSLVNVCPQNANLNSGLWNSIEIDCRRWARQFGDIYIVCGPLLMRQEHETIGINQIVVPEAFFKVVLCLNGNPKGMGFVVRNTEGNRKRDLYYNSIDQVERITGMDFFPFLPDEIENAVESKLDMELWR